jgi:hypothetical protein
MKSSSRSGWQTARCLLVGPPRALRVLARSAWPGSIRTGPTCVLPACAVRWAVDRPASRWAASSRKWPRRACAPKADSHDGGRRCAWRHVRRAGCEAGRWRPTMRLPVSACDPSNQISDLLAGQPANSCLGEHLCQPTDRSIQTRDGILAFWFNCKISVAFAQSIRAGRQYALASGGFTRYGA